MINIKLGLAKLQYSYYFQNLAANISSLKRPFLYIDTESFIESRKKLAKVEDNNDKNMKFYNYR